MPRFHFHLEHHDRSPDDEGVELSDVEAAKCHAVQMIAETLCHEPSKFWQAETYRVTVTDDKGLILLSVEMVATLSAAMPVRAQ